MQRMQLVEKVSKFSFSPETGVQYNFEGAEQLKRSDEELKISHESICYLKAFKRLDIFKDKEYIIELILQLTNQVHSVTQFTIKFQLMCLFTNVMML